jgi:hypothetical protein
MAGSPALAREKISLDAHESSVGSADVTHSALNSEMIDLA